MIQLFSLIRQVIYLYKVKIKVVYQVNQRFICSTENKDSINQLNLTMSAWHLFDNREAWQSARLQSVYNEVQAKQRPRGCEPACSACRSPHEGDVLGGGSIRSVRRDATL